MSSNSSTRREILKRASALSIVGAAGSAFGLQLATMGEAAAQAAPAGYKALVCIFMFGGNDSANMLLATDSDSWGRYTAQRASIALAPPGAAPSGSDLGRPAAWGGVLPIISTLANPVPLGTNASSRTFAIHPHMAPLLPIWQQGRLAAMANVGPLIEPATKAEIRTKNRRVPEQLGSHNDQQSIWQSGIVEGARRGWGGLMADLMLSSNGTGSAYTAISTAGNAVWLAGQTVTQYQIANNWTAPAVEIEAATSPTRSVFNGPNMGQTIRDVISNTSNTHVFMKDYASKTTRAREAAGAINAQFSSTAQGSSIAMPANTVNPVTLTTGPNQLALQLRNVAKIIAANAALGLKRQVFFLNAGASFDFHSTQNLQQPPQMRILAEAMAYFDNALSNVNGADLRSMVTTFTASDFGRTFNINGDGTDHGWGGHHFVMGGAVKGGSVYGQYPTLGVDTGGFDNPNMLGNIFIPSTSVDQYAATLGRWFGVSDTSLFTILPNLTNFSQRDIGFMQV